MLRVEVVRTLDGLRRLQPEWDALCDRSPEVTPFQRPAWLLPWTARLAIDELETVVVREGDDLVGLLPAFVWGPPGERTLSLLGAGLSDHLDAIAAAGYARAVLDALQESLSRRSERWSAWAFDEIGPGAVLHGLATPDGVTAAARPQSVCPVLRLEGALGLGDAVRAPQAARWRKARRRCERAGEVTFGRVASGDVRDALTVVLDLHRRRWGGRRELAGFDDPTASAFHAEAAAAFAGRGALRLYLLRVGGRPAAGIYGFREGRRLHLYAQGIEPALAPLSPGVVALGSVIADAIAEGVGEIDFLRGDEPYKYDWGAVNEPNVRLEWARHRPAGDPTLPSLPR